jgi:chromosome segregation protein
MIQFEKLRLHGFKSFVDKTELEIGPGLTGIVGPNGCGKSNLVEALRWSMGENSSKRMRGSSGSMEDVIFNGTENRPSRNMAEVSVLLSNADKSAPAPYNNADEIEIVRKIEKDHGSGYRINGKPARARDVQIFYADILAGANSPFLVSQGRVAQLIQAKPSDRRQVLEDAAGISGLHARRHEAELRLRATDNNLKRLEDLLGSMETRLQALKKQARQATRYRNLSAQIRQLELMISAVEWRTAHEKLQEVERTFGEAESLVGERMIVVNQLTKTQGTQAQDLPDLRQKDAELGAALQTQNLALQRLEDEAARLSQQLDETKAQLTQAQTDRTHEKGTLAENTQILERLATEESALQENAEKEDETLQAQEELKEELQSKVKVLEAEYTDMMAQVTEQRIKKENLEKQIEADTRRNEELDERIKTLKAELADKRSESSAEQEITALRANIEVLEKEIQTQREQLEKIATDKNALSATLETAREALKEKDQKREKISAEIEALQSLMDGGDEESYKQLVDDIKAESGFEAALSRALSDALSASTDDSAPVRWLSRDIKNIDLPPLPAKAQALEPHVKAPAALKMALSQIGVVENEDEGSALFKELKAGQALVSKDGTYWRWDGLHITASAPDRHAIQLKQKNRLAELLDMLPKAEKEAEKAENQIESAKTKRADKEQQEQELRSEIQQKERDVRTAQTELNNKIESQSQSRMEIAKMEEAIAQAENSLAGVLTSMTESQALFATFEGDDLEEQQNAIDEKRAALDAERESYQEALRNFEISRQEHSRRTARLQAIGDERVNLRNRCIRSNERIKELEERETSLQAKQEELKKRPAEIKIAREKLLEKISAAESEKSTISDKLAVCENELAETTKALKDAERALSDVKEKRASAQATAEERQRQIQGIRQYIIEHFDMEPNKLLAEAAVSEDDVPNLSELKDKREQDVRSRDAIGPVNLRAETEADELEKELGGILHERNDLTQAIDELRQGINKLNTEARERLEAAFDHVNGYFRQMFTQLFKGGNAHLALIESDDPLEAGLEIFAQPPGKALQSLTLLSGGEQALTAIALIFAMFLTNPAPICVLDEVDAPLDDANVDRFCDLLEEFADRGETRFLVISHHRLTMARMDRLYGVTMAERGVSKLVSVDLNKQLDFLDEVA